MSPSYYHDLTCDVLGTPVEEEKDSGAGVYLYGDYECIINI